MAFAKKEIAYIILIVSGIKVKKSQHKLIKIIINKKQ